MTTTTPPTITRNSSSSKGTSDVFHFFGRYGLVLLFALIVLVFGIAKPEQFLTWNNLKYTLDMQTPVIIGGLAVMIPLLTDSIDLSIAANISLANIVLAQLTSINGIPVATGIVVAIVVSALVGLINGLIVVKFQVPSFVGTLGMATLLAGVGLAISNSSDILTVPAEIKEIIRTEVIGLPLAVFYGIVCMLLVALVLRYLPVGRKLRAVGANPRAAALAGIRPGRYRIVSFVFSGMLAGIAGVVITGQLAAATASGSATSLLLPIFAAVFLGSTAFTPGRHNVLGLFVAALFLAFLSSGLVLMGAPIWVSPIINGGALVIAVALSYWAQRARADSLRAQQLKQIDRDSATESATPSGPTAPGAGDSAARTTP